MLVSRITPLTSALRSGRLVHTHLPVKHRRRGPSTDKSAQPVKQGSICQACSSATLSILAGAQHLQLNFVAVFRSCRFVAADRVSTGVHPGKTINPGTSLSQVSHLFVSILSASRVPCRTSLSPIHSFGFLVAIVVSPGAERTKVHEACATNGCSARNHANGTRIWSHSVCHLLPTVDRTVHLLSRVSSARHSDSFGMQRNAASGHQIVGIHPRGI